MNLKNETTKITLTFLFMKLKMHSDANRGLTVIFLSISFFLVLEVCKKWSWSKSGTTCRERNILEIWFWYSTNWQRRRWNVQIVVSWESIDGDLAQPQIMNATILLLRLLIDCFYKHPNGKKHQMNFFLISKNLLKNRNIAFYISMIHLIQSTVHRDKKWKGLDWGYDLSSLNSTKSHYDETFSTFFSLSTQDKTKLV